MSRRVDDRASVEPVEDRRRENAHLRHVLERSEGERVRLERERTRLEREIARLKDELEAPPMAGTDNAHSGGRAREP